MTAIDQQWFHERGLLHDARITTVDHDPDQLILGIDDEWSNQNDEKSASRAGIMTFRHAKIVSGELAGLEDGWVSEAYFDAEGRVHLDFCDREPLVIEAQAVEWSSISRG